MSINFKCRQIYAGLVIYLAILLFALNVHAGNVTLSWTSPSYNEDGSDFVDLAGYNIYYGTTSNIYTNIIHVDNVTTYQITNLTEGITYYFVITVYNTSGNESGYSSEESITISTSAVPAPEITVTDSVAPVTDYHVPFGNITEGHSSTQTVTLTNDGNADLLIGNIAHYIPTGPGFSILADYCSGQTLSPSLNCTFRVRFSPTAEGEFNDSFDIPSSDSAKSPVIITLAGTGVPSSVPAMQVTDSVSPICSATFEFMVEYLKTKKIPGSQTPLAEDNRIQHKVGELYAQLEATRRVTYSAARLVAERPGTPEANTAIHHAKYMVSELGPRLTSEAIRICGGSTISRKMPLERYFREARCGGLMPATSDECLFYLGKAAFGADLSKPSETYW